MSMLAGRRVPQRRARALRAAILVLLVAMLQWALPPWALGQDRTALETAQAFEQVLVDAIARAEPSVVAIARVRKDELASGGIAEVRPTDPDFVPNDYGTGVVVDRNGLILTTYHVLGNPEQNDYYVWVNRRPYRATVPASEAVRRPFRVEKVKAADPWLDLAILQIEASDLQPITFGDTGHLKKGQFVIALGNPFAIARDGQVSASRGIIANLQRSAPRSPDAANPARAKETLHHYGTLIQTDAKLNVGTSGGALINLKGEMIGLTTSLAAAAGYEAAGGYAIPTDEHFQRSLEALKAGRDVAYGFLGVWPEHLSDVHRRQGHFGARIVEVVPGTPAAQAGLRLDDIITHVDGQPIYDANDLIRQLSSRLAESRVRLTLVRGGTATGRSLPLDVVLSKKYISLSRPVIAEQPRASWRGMQVEYATALPQLSQISRQLDPRGCVGVLQVEPDSAAWKAGLRPGDLISHVDGARVGNPRTFREAVSAKRGPVRLHLSTGAGEPPTVRVVANQ